MKIEVLFSDRIGNYRNGQVAEIEEGPFLRAILKGGKADVLNPPDWDAESYLSGAMKSGSSSSTKQIPNRETPARLPSRGGPRKPSTKGTKKAQGNSSEGHGGSSKLVENRTESGERADSN